MLLFDRKKAMNQILGPPPDHKKEEVNPAHELAKEAIASVHAKDHEGFANATKALFVHFQNDSDQDGDVHDPITGREEY